MKFLRLRRLQHLTRSTAARKQHRRVRKSPSLKAVRKQRQPSMVSDEPTPTLHMPMSDVQADFRQPRDSTDISSRGNAVSPRSWDLQCAMEEQQHMVSRRRPWDLQCGMEEQQHMEANAPPSMHGTFNNTRPSWMPEERPRSNWDFEREETLPCGLLESQVGDLFDREITPEDYEMLLQLDEMVAKPTASLASLASLAAAEASSFVGECCTICLVSFDSEDAVTALSCGHPFHSNCVHKWLSEHSNRCPVCSHEA